MSTHNITVSICTCIYKKISLDYPKLQLLDFSKGLKEEFETAVVNESSVFEPLKFYSSTM